MSADFAGAVLLEGLASALGGAAQAVLLLLLLHTSHQQSQMRNLLAQPRLALRLLHALTHQIHLALLLLLTLRPALSNIAAVQNRNKTHTKKKREKNPS